MTVLTTPGQIEGARLLALRAMLKLEMLGMQLAVPRRSKGRTAYAILKGMGFKGTRAEVLAQINEVRNSLTKGITA